MDVRATEKDKVEIYKSFRPGDVVLARVVCWQRDEGYMPGLKCLGQL